MKGYGRILDVAPCSICHTICHRNKMIYFRYAAPFSIRPDTTKHLCRSCYNEGRAKHE